MSPTDLAHRFENRICVVTGATSGNGLAVVRVLLKMGARVHALGRNQERLFTLGLAGAETYTTDLSDKASIDKTLALLPERIDFVFHLAGNALVGDATDDEVARFWESDYFGPVRLLEGLKPRMNPGGGMGVVTSASAHLGEVRAIRYYQRVKNQMVSWWGQHYDSFQAQGVGLTLISMGVINTGIWDKTKHLPALTRPLVRSAFPGPEKYVSQILEDVALHRLVSYPGVGAKLFPVDDCLQGVTPALAAILIKSWFWMFGERHP